MTILRDDGVALVAALMAMALMSALGAALILITSSETIIAANFRDGQEGLYAAEGALERALDDLSAVPDWNTLLDGSTRSAFVDGPPNGERILADGSSLDLGQTVNMLNCQKVTPCSVSDLTANTPQRPWGANNPVWRLYAHAPLSSLLPAGTVNSSYYAIVLVADDPSENDNDPVHDGSNPTNAGTGILVMRGEAFGPRGTHRVVELTVARTSPAAIRVLSWRGIR